jgi:sugar lactone lactonase YvrE
MRNCPVVQRAARRNGSRQQKNNDDALGYRQGFRYNWQSASVQQFPKSGSNRINRNSQVSGGNMFCTTSPSPAHFSITANGGSVSSKAFQAFRMAKSLHFVPLTMMALAVCCLALLASAPLQAQTNIINTVAGGGAPANVATQADLPGPVAAVEDAAGNVYISPPSSYYIFKVTSSGNLSIYAGTGIFGGGGDNGPATKANLGGVSALALDAKGDLYLADKGNDNIRCVIAASGGCLGSASPVGDIVTLVNANGRNCYPTTAACGDGGPAIDAQISYAQALFIDSANDIWIADTYDYKIRCVVGASGGCGGSALPVGDILTLAGTGAFCDGPLFDCGNGGPALQAKFDLPSGVAVDAAGNLYIADTRDFTVRVVNAKTQIITNFAGNGNYCSNPLSPCGDGAAAVNANLWDPTGILFDSSGDLYIADTFDNRIRCVVGVSGGCGGSALPVGDITTVAGDGNQGFAGDGGAATSAYLNLPNSLFIDAKGNLFIADTGNQRIREVAKGNINTIAGGGPNGDGGNATSATLASPNTVAWDSSGNYYIADAANNQVRKVTTAGIISAVAGTGIAGLPNTSPILAVNATLNAPQGLAVDASNNIYVADTGNQVIREIVASTGDIVTVAGDGNSCVPNNAKCGDGGPATKAQLTTPTSVAFDSKGNLYIADAGAHRVRHVNVSGTITTLAGTGVKGFSGNNGPATKARLNRAYGVAVDSSGNVYIADSPNNQIRCVVEVSGGCGGAQYPIGTIVAFAFDTKPRFRGDGGPALSASMWNPLEVAVDPSDNVFVGGGNDNLVRRIDAVSLTVETVAGNPLHPQQPGFAGDGGPCTQGTMDNVGLAVDKNGDLLVADTGNNRVRVCILAPLASLSKKLLTFPTEPIGQSSPPQSVTLKDSGSADLAISGEQIAGFDAQDFSISSNTCGKQLAPGGSCSISVVFTPTKAGKRTAKLLINDALGQQTVSLVGTGQ